MKSNVLALALALATATAVSAFANETAPAAPKAEKKEAITTTETAGMEKAVSPVKAHKIAKAKHNKKG